MDIDSPVPRPPSPPLQHEPPANTAQAPVVTSQATPPTHNPSGNSNPTSIRSSPIRDASAPPLTAPAVDAQSKGSPAQTESAAPSSSQQQQQQQHPSEAQIQPPQPLPHPHASSLAGMTEARERGATPSSTASEHVAPDATPVMNGHDEAMDVTENGDHDATSSSSGSCPMSSAASGAATVDIPVANPEDSAEDMDRFIKRMEMEKKISQLQQRLELASFKTNHGWSDMSIKEIETRLPSPQEQKRTQVVIGGGRYDPPSPSRPWQLADVLWQPLPQPGRSVPSKVARPPNGPFHAPSHSLPGHLPSANGQQRNHPPNSPRRHRMDEYLNRPTASPLRQGKNGGHRRSSSSVSSLQFLQNDPYKGTGSPLRPKDKKTGKKRSQSHSNLREASSASSRTTTTQDVDAARALTSMLGSGAQRSPEEARFPAPPPPGQRSMQLPPLHTSSLPGPFASDMPPPRPRAQSFAAESREPFEHALGHERKRSTDYRPYLPPMRQTRGPSHSRGLSMDSSQAFRDRFSSRPDWHRERYGSTERERYASAERFAERFGSAGPSHHERRTPPFGPPGHERHPSQERFPGGPPPGGPERFPGSGFGGGYESYRVEEEPSMAGRGEEDKAAAELMMFLATSPSPVVGRKREPGTASSFAGTARVLFDEGPTPAYPRPGPPPLSAAPRR